ncbi:unnamed protein product [Kuraishia capsulata CBS 1993]|uniref:ribonuclease III n=1 Tax=Kuraishia capsulata CBS 1993 TaxID=1382522 RepID=W6MRN7_9ASCO|nr:uncharacterized protein KUCA_T00005372001 [Kuraishia capsulata CBS 1993]CDK29384.1 unnamed protein product [Kuraishia capsulata CBS 1993]
MGSKKRVAMDASSEISGSLPKKVRGSEDTASSTTAYTDRRRTGKLQMVDVYTLENVVRQLQMAMKTIVNIAPGSDEIKSLSDSSTEDPEKVEILATYSASARMKLATLLKDAIENGRLKDFYEAITSYDGSAGAETFQLSDVELSRHETPVPKKNASRTSGGDYPPPLVPIASLSLLARVFTHKSRVNNKLSKDLARQLHNERLELTGDSVLNTCITMILNEEFPQASEGQITVWRSKLVSNANLVKWARLYKFDEKLHKETQEASLEKGKQKIFADVFEAYVGALSMEAGTDLKRIRDWLYDLSRPMLASFAKEGQGLLYDPQAKVTLYALIGSAKLSPRYTILVAGDGNDDSFEVSCTMGGEELARAKGRSYKEASSKAAAKALEDREALSKYSMERKLATRDEQKVTGTEKPVDIALEGSVEGTKKQKKSKSKKNPEENQA